MLVLRVLLVGLGLLLVINGILAVRVWRKSGGEPSYTPRAIAGLAVSRLLAGIAFVVGAAVALWEPIVAGAIFVLLGNIGMSAARSRLERHPSA
jgi:hypothetical protein